ncbi:hypothetical protein PanWU01x14_279060, partial [Parasponia andersonii]
PAALARLSPTDDDAAQPFSGIDRKAECERKVCKAAPKLRRNSMIKSSCAIIDQHHKLGCLS